MTKISSEGFRLGGTIFLKQEETSAHLILCFLLEGKRKEAITNVLVRKKSHKGFHIGIAVTNQNQGLFLIHINTCIQQLTHNVCFSG